MIAEYRDEKDDTELQVCLKEDVFRSSRTLG